MPRPQKGESRNDFVGRCIRVLRREGKHKQDEIVGKCEGMFDFYAKKEQK